MSYFIAEVTLREFPFKVPSLQHAMENVPFLSSAELESKPLPRVSAPNESPVQHLAGLAMFPADLKTP